MMSNHIKRRYGIGSKGDVEACFIAIFHHLKRRYFISLKDAYKHLLMRSTIISKDDKMIVFKVDQVTSALKTISTSALKTMLDCVFSRLDMVSIRNTIFYFELSFTNVSTQR